MVETPRLQAKKAGRNGRFFCGHEPSGFHQVALSVVFQTTAEMSKAMTTARQ
jgi:hypothetical protein